MSRTVDERVVSMQFDNAQFERNVKTSMNTLDELKQSLNMEGAAQSFQSIEQASQNISFDRMAASVEALKNRFSTLGIVGMQVIENLTDAAMKLVNKAFGFLTNGIIRGGITRAMNLENAHFQLQGLLQDEEAVAAVMQNVNDAVDGTAYSLDAAAKVASQLAASGMRAGDEMFTSLRAVAGVAAMTNSEYSDIGEIFTTVSGNGRLMGEQLLQLSSRGLNAAATLADYLTKTGNGAKVTEADVREMVSKGKIDFATFAAAMDDAFGEHAKKANETFTGALSNIKAALSRIGALFISPLIEQNGPLVQLFNTLRECINDLKSAIGPLATFFVDRVTKMAEALKGFMNRLDSDGRVKMFKDIVSTILRVLINLGTTFKNIFAGIGSILKPIGQAFRDIFPIDVGANIISFTKILKDLTSRMKLSSEESKNLREAFKGIFSVFSLGVDVIKYIVQGIGTLLEKMTGIRGGVLGVAAAIGNWLSNMAESIRETNVLKAVIGGVIDFLGQAIDGIKKFSSYLSEKFVSPGLEGLLNLLEKLWEIVKELGGKIKAFFSSIGESFTGDSLGGALTLSGALILLRKVFMSIFVDLIPKLKRWDSIITDGLVNTLKTVIQAPEGLVSAFKALTSSLWNVNRSLKYDNLKKLATALLMLAAAMLIISLIDVDNMASAFMGVTALVAELLGVLKVYDTLGLEGQGMIRVGIYMIEMSIAVTILAGALKRLASLSTEEIIKGLVGILGITEILVAAAQAMDSESASITKFAGQMLLMSIPIAILSSVAKKLAALNWEELAKGGAGLLAITAMLVGAAKIMDGEDAVITKFAGQMLVMSAAIAILGAVAKNLSALSWEELAKGGAGLLGITAMLVAAAQIMDGKDAAITKFAGQMLIMSVAIAILAAVGKNLASLSWEELGKGGMALLGITEMLLLAAQIMSEGEASILRSSFAMLVMSISLAILGQTLKSISSLSCEELSNGLMTLAAALLILGLAGDLLEPVVPSILALSAAVALFGIGCLAAGVGIFALSSALVMLSGVTLTATASMVASLKVFILGTLGMIPEMSQALVTAIISLVDVFVQCIPELAQGFVKMILGVLDVLIEYAPQFVEGLFTLALSLLTLLTEKAPELVDAVVNFIIAIINGITPRIPDILSAVTQLIGAIFSGLSQAIAPIIQNVLGPILDIFNNLIVGIVQAIAPYLPEIAACFTEMTQIISDAIVKIVEILAPYIPNIQAMVEATIPALIAIANAFTTLVENIAPIIDRITNLVQQLGDSISQILQSVCDVLTTCGATITTIFEGIALVIETCGNSISEVLDSLANNIDTVFNGIGTVIESVGTSIKSVLDGIANVISSIGEAALNAGTGFEHLANGVATITKLNLADMATSMAAVSVALGKLTKHASGLSDAGDGMKKIADGVKISASGFDSMSKDIESVISSLSSVSSKVDAAVTALTSLGNIGPTVSNSFTSAMSSVIEAVSNSMTVLVSAGQQMASNIAIGIRNGIPDITSAANSAGSGGATGAEQSYGSFSSAGEYLGDGLVAGINAKKTAVYNAGYALGQEAVKGEKAGQQSKSPSKLTVKAGKWLGEGLIIGMEKMTSSVYKAGYGLGETATDTISSVISKVSDYINSDIDTQPTIRPVLDLSDVTAGASTIGSLFNTNPSVGVLANVGSISSMMNRSQNGATNNDVIAAINDLGNNLAKSSGDTYQINGVTYDDGSNITDAVRTLVRAARIERRV